MPTKWSIETDSYQATTQARHTTICVPAFFCYHNPRFTYNYRVMFKRSDETTDPNVVPGLAAGGVAASSPFWGMIGERKLVNDPHKNPNIPRAESRAHLASMAEPGDIIITSRQPFAGFKTPQTAVSGSEFFHTAVIAGKDAQGRTIILDAGHLDPAKGHTGKDLLALGQDIDTYMAGAIPGREFSDVVLLRPEVKPTPAQHAAYMESITKGAHKYYDVPGGTRALFKDMFAPKIKGGVSAEEACRDSHVCSTYPAKAYHDAGIVTEIAPGKHYSEVMPSDYLREGSGFKAVAAHTTQETISPLQRAAIRLGPRVAIGAGLGAAGYEAAQNPLPSAALLSTVLAPSAVRHIAARVIAKKRGISVGEAMQHVERQVPNPLHLFRPSDLTHAPMPNVKGRVLGRTLPIGIAAGLATYGLGHWLSDKAGPATAPAEV